VIYASADGPANSVPAGITDYLVQAVNWKSIFALKISHSTKPHFGQSTNTVGRSVAAPSTCVITPSTSLLPVFCDKHTIRGYQHEDNFTQEESSPVSLPCTLISSRLYDFIINHYQASLRWQNRLVTLTTVSVPGKCRLKCSSLQRTHVHPPTHVHTRI
jgi:hypothetical protein